MKRLTDDVVEPTPREDEKTTTEIESGHGGLLAFERIAVDA